MPDKISQYRQLRLSLFPSPDGLEARWAVTALNIRRGVPSGTILADGVIQTPGGMARESDLFEALQGVVAQLVP